MKNNTKKKLFWIFTRDVFVLANEAFIFVMFLWYICKVGLIMLSCFFGLLLSIKYNYCVPSASVYRASWCYLCLFFITQQGALYVVFACFACARMFSLWLHMLFSVTSASFHSPKNIKMGELGFLIGVWKCKWLLCLSLWPCDKLESVTLTVGTGSSNPVSGCRKWKDLLTYKV